MYYVSQKRSAFPDRGESPGHDGVADNSRPAVGTDLFGGGGKGSAASGTDEGFLLDSLLPQLQGVFDVISLLGLPAVQLVSCGGTEGDSRVFRTDIIEVNRDI